jgi:hypothetical protein
LAGGLWCFLISLADLPQAIAVRRHGMSMVVVVAVMVAELHLLPTLSGTSQAVNILSAICARLAFVPGYMRSGRRKLEAI